MSDRTSKPRLLTEAQRREAFAVFLAALDAKDMPVSMAASFQAGWDACMRRIHSSVETTALPSHEALADHLRTLTASTNCPVCGKSGMHEHTPTELIIYRNGVKYGRSLYQTAPVGTPRIGQCEATVPAKWHTPEHLCEFEATTEINGQKFCGHHLKSSPEEPSESCVHNLTDCVSTLVVIDPYKAKCRVCYNFFDLPLDGPPSQVKAVEVRAFGTSIDPEKASGEPSDIELIEAAAELHHRLEMGQVELDAEAKRVLYSNISRLTRR